MLKELSKRIQKIGDNGLGIDFLLFTYISCIILIMMFSWVDGDYDVPLKCEPMLKAPSLEVVGWLAKIRRFGL